MKNTLILGCLMILVELSSTSCIEGYNGVE